MRIKSVNACGVNTEYDPICNISMSVTHPCQETGDWRGVHQTTGCDLLLEGRIQHYFSFFI